MKRILALVLVFTLAVLTGCDSDTVPENQQDGDSATERQVVKRPETIPADMYETAENVFRIEELPLGDNFTYSMYTVSRTSDGNTGLLGYDGMKPVFVHITNGEQKVTMTELEIPDDGSIADITSADIMSDKSILVTGCGGKSFSDGRLMKFSPDGKLTSTFDYEHTNGGRTRVMYDAQSDRILLLSNTDIHILDGSFEYITTAVCTDPLASTAADKSGKVFAASRYNGVLFELDAKYAAFTEIRAEDGKSSWHFSADAQPYLADDKSVTKNGTVLLDMKNSALSADEMRILDIVNDELFIAETWDIFRKEPRPVWLARVPDDQLTPKIKLRIAAVAQPTSSGGKNTLENAVTMFNRQSDICRIELHTFYDKSDARAKVYPDDVFNDAITLENEKYDLVLLSPQMASKLSVYTNKDYFADLTPYIDTYGTDLLRSVRSAYTVSGKIHHLPMRMKIRTYAGKTENIGTGSLTTGKLYELTDRFSESAKLFSSNRRIFTSALFDRIDIQNGSCSFDTPEFIRFLNYIKASSEHTKELMTEIEMSSAYNIRLDEITESLTENEVILYDMPFSSIGKYALAKLMFGNVPITLCGYPSDTRTGAHITSDFTMGIVSSSDRIWAAWEFIEFMLSKYVQTSETVNGDYLPVTETGLEAMLELDEIYFHITEKRGSDTKQVVATQMSEPFPSDYPMLSRLVHIKLDSTDKAEIRRFLTECEMPSASDPEVYEIMLDEYTQLLGGAATAEETAKRLQSRVGIYVSERYG